MVKMTIIKKIINTHTIMANNVFLVVKLELLQSLCDFVKILQLLPLIGLPHFLQLPYFINPIKELISTNIFKFFARGV